MAGGTYQIFVTVDASGAITGLSKTKVALDETKAAAKSADDTFKGLFKFFAIGEVVSQLYKAVDGYLAVKSAIQVAGSTGENTYQVFNKLLDIANQTRTPLESLSDLYRNLSLYSKSLGASQADLLKVTKEVGEAIALQGGSSTRAQNGILQLAKALEEGKIQGQTFNALLKDLGPLFAAISTATGNSSIKLREMAKSGELSSQGLFEMIKKAQPILDKQFERSVVTLGQAFTVLENNLQGAVADIDHATGGFSLFAGAIVDIAKSIRTVGPLLVNLTVTILALRVGMALFATTSTQAGAAALLFGKNVLTAKGEVDLFKLSFGSIAVILVTAATLMLQFGDRVKISLGPIKNLHDLILATGTVIGLLVNHVFGLRASMVLLVGIFLSARLGLGSYGLVITTVIAALVRFNASQHTVIITLGATGVALLLLYGYMNRGGIIANALVGIWNGMVKTLTILGEAFYSVALAETAADVAAAPLAIAYGLLVVAVLALVAAIAIFISQIPGVSDMFTALASIVSLGWDAAVEGVTRYYKSVKQLLELIPGVKELFAWLAKVAEIKWDQTVQGVEKVAKSAEDMTKKIIAAIEETLKLDKALDAGKDAGNNAAQGWGNAADAADKLANKAANAAAQVAKLNSVTGGGGGATLANGGFPTKVGGTISTGSAPPIQPDTGWSDAANQADQAFRDKVFTSNFGTESTVFNGGLSGFFPPGGIGPGVESGDDIAKLMQTVGDATTALKKQIADDLTAHGKLTGADKNAIYQQYGYGAFNSVSVSDVKGQLAYAKKQNDIAQKAADDAAKAAQKAQEDAAKAQAEMQRLQQIEQAKNNSIEQLTLQALNAFGVNKNSQLGGDVRGLIGNISNLQGKLGDSNFTDPIARAETGRQVQILTDQLKALTDAVTATTEDNPYLKYAQNVYGDLVGIQGKVVQAAAAASTAANGSAAILSNVSQSSGGGSSSGSSSHSGSGITGVSGLGGKYGFAYAGAFADGGSFDVDSTGRYAADLHAGETVTVTRKDAPASKTINVNMNVNGVQDVDGFRRSRKQILATLYRDLMAVGEQT